MYQTSISVDFFIGLFEKVVIVEEEPVTAKHVRTRRERKLAPGEIDVREKNLQFFYWCDHRGLAGIAGSGRVASICWSGKCLLMG